MTSNYWEINKQWTGKDTEGRGRSLIYDLSQHLPKRAEKTTENVSRDSRSPGPYLNRAHPEHESEVLTTRPRRPVIHS